jgi:hypothetical protein
MTRAVRGERLTTRSSRVVTWTRERALAETLHECRAAPWVVWEETEALAVTAGLQS